MNFTFLLLSNVPNNYYELLLEMTNKPSLSRNIIFVALKDISFPLINFNYLFALDK